MTPRPRKLGSKDLPLNLYRKKVKNNVYYQYKHPLSGKFIGLGTDKKQAVAAAIEANSILIDEDNRTLTRITAKSGSFKEYLIHYQLNVIPNKRVNGFPLSDQTIAEHNRIIRRITEELGYLELTQISQTNIKQYLDLQSSAETFNKHRAMLFMVFKCAISDGLINANLPGRILKRDKEVVKRSRLTLEQYKLIYEHARPVIQNAMELSLNAMQRRTDVQSWRFDSEKDGYYYLIQSKTRKHGVSAYLRIPIDLPTAYSHAGAKTLKGIVNNCRDNIACPFLIHEKKKRRMRSKEKEHMLQLSPKQISSGFTEARIKTGLFVGVEFPPTFHELLSLGEHLREKQGWDIRNIQILRGHTSEKMTRQYLDGHEWTTVDING